jgi:DNA-binding CsgD family transcriptional regulator
LDHVRDYGQVPSVESLSLPGRLEASFASRIAELSAPTRKAMLMLALDGRSGLRELAEVGVSVEDLAEAESAGTVVVDSTAGSVSFRHPLMRSALVGAATSVERRRVHQELASHLDDGSDRRAWHLANAATGTDDEVAQLLDDLSRRSFARGDAVGATTAILRAAGLSSRAEDRSRRLSEAAFLSADVTGEFSQASTLLADARSEVGHGAGSMYAAAASAQLAVNSGANLSAALKLIEDAVLSGEHGWSTEDQELMATMRTWLHLCSYAGDPASWQVYFDALGRLVPEAPTALKAESGALGDPVRRGSDARITLERLAGELDADTDPTIILSATLSAMYIDMVDVYRPSAWRFVSAGREGGAPRPYARSLIHLAVDDVWRGAWERALKLSAEGAVVCAQNGFDNGAWCSDYIDSVIAAARGNVTVARTWAAEHNKTWIACQAWGVQRFSHQPLILAAVADGNWEEAYRLACQLSPPGAFASYVPQATWVAFDLVEAAVRTGRTVEAEAHVRAMVDAQLDQVSRRLALHTSGARALVDDGPEWRESFEAALRTPDAESWPFDLARVRLIYGERLRKAGHLVRAREVLHDALDSFDRLEARPWVNRAKGELRSAGDPQARTAVPVHAGPVSLTAQEWSVAELAATGLSNREIADRLYLSPRTVSGHLYNIFPKLGISSRAALRDAIAQLTAP